MNLCAQDKHSPTGIASFQHLEMSSGRVDAATRGAKQFAGLAITVPEEEPVACLVYAVNQRFLQTVFCLVSSIC